MEEQQSTSWRTDLGIGFVCISIDSFILCCTSIYSSSVTIVAACQVVSWWTVCVLVGGNPLCGDLEIEMDLISVVVVGSQSVVVTQVLHCILCSRDIDKLE